MLAELGSEQGKRHSVRSYTLGEVSVTGLLFGGPSEPSPDAIREPSRMRVLITVKAAPNPSATYGETVCVAGLRVDQGHEGWVRLYPINFRYIEHDHTFRKYDVVTLDAIPASEGRRESWRPKIDTLNFETHLDSWPTRMPHLLPFAHNTMCELNRRALKGGPSLGLIAAQQVEDLEVKEHPGWTPDEQQKIANYVNQQELFDLGRPKTALEAPRFKAAYRWRCPEPGCKSHTQGLLDWEFTAFQRRLSNAPAQAKASIRKRWLDELCSAANDVYFYVGNQAKRHQTFSILGVVYPKRSTRT